MTEALEQIFKVIAMLLKAAAVAGAKVENIQTAVDLEMARIIDQQKQNEAAAAKAMGLDPSSD